MAMGLRTNILNPVRRNHGGHLEPVETHSAFPICSIDTGSSSREKSHGLLNSILSPRILNLTCEILDRYGMSLHLSFTE